MLKSLPWVSRFVSTWSQSRLSISTLSNSSPWQSRNLNWDQDFLILSWHQCPDLKVSIKIEKFIETWKFHHFLTIRLNLDREVSGFLNISCWDFSICQDFLSFSYSRCLHNVEISWQISIRLGLSRQILTILICLDNLDSSQQSRFVSTILTKILTRQNLDRRENLDSF